MDDIPKFEIKFDRKALFCVLAIAYTLFRPNADKWQDLQAAMKPVKTIATTVAGGNGHA